MILTSAKMNQHSTHLGHKSSTSTVTVWTLHTHTRTRLIALAKVEIHQQTFSVSAKPSQYDNSQQHISLLLLFSALVLHLLSNLQKNKAVIDPRLRPYCHLLELLKHTSARKATHGLDGQHQDVDRTPRGRVNRKDRGQG